MTTAKMKPRKPLAAPRGSCRLTLTINGTRYRVRPVPCDDRAARRCFELRKADRTRYHVSVHAYGAECTCADWVFRRDGRDPLGCKHVRAMVAVGLLEAT